jgi:hypothetical protein
LVMDSEMLCSENPEWAMKNGRKSDGDRILPLPSPVQPQ